MNPIEYAVLEIRNTIPAEILRLGFPTSGTAWENSMESMDWRIRNEVIEKRVRVDLDLIGGTELQIPVDDIQIDYVDPYTNVLHVPAERTQNRTIVQAYEFSYGPTGYPVAASLTGNYGTYASSPRGVRTSNVVTSSSGVGSFTIFDLKIIGHNTIMVRYNGLFARGMWLRCRVSDDEGMTSIPPTAYSKFSQMCVLACKAYLFRTLSIQIDAGQLEGGMQLGAIRDLLWNFQEAEELYQQARARWRGIAVMNDPIQHRNFIKSQFGLL